MNRLDGFRTFRPSGQLILCDRLAYTDNLIMIRSLTKKKLILYELQMVGYRYDSFCDRLSYIDKLLIIPSPTKKTFISSELRVVGYRYDSRHGDYGRL